MEISDVKRRVTAMIDQARRTAAERRSRNDQATHDYELFLQRTAVPLFRQVAAVLKPEGFAFRVFTPAGSVRLMSETGSEDYVELSLDTAGDQPKVIGLTRVARGHRIVESERPITAGAIPDISEEDVLDFLTTELQAFVRR
jgi:hypothetical protein